VKIKKIVRAKYMLHEEPCRGCWSPTKQKYKVGKHIIVACCSDCARVAIECIETHYIPSKIQAKMSKETLEAIERFWVPLHRAIYSKFVSRDLFMVKPKSQSARKTTTTNKEDDDTCLGISDNSGSDCEHEFASEILCDECKYGPYRDIGGKLYDPRYPREKQRERGC
jgi:hypothetical protein